MIEFYQTYKEELIPILQTFPGNRKGGTLTSLFYEASITFIQKPNKDATKKEIKTRIFSEHRDKDSQ
jgi:hypothetical protein